jgi:outer membrane protein assembly factor BamB
MQRGLQSGRRLFFACASVVALLGVVACADTGPHFSIFSQQPQQGSGEAITLGSANQMHPLWVYQPANGTLGSSVMASGIVYLSYSSNVSVVGAGGNSGNLTPTVTNGSVSILEALDAQSGRRLWRFQAPEFPDYGARPLVANDTIYFALTYSVCALNAQSGVARWCAEVVDRANDAEYIVDGELAVENGLLFVGAYHTLIALDATSGKRMWSVQTPMRSSHLAVGNDRVYVSAAGGQLSAFDANTGQLIWRAIQTPTPKTWAPVPFLDAGTLYVLAGRTLAAFDGRRGNQLWQVSLVGGIDGGEITPPGPVFANVGGTPYMLALELNDSTLTSPITTQLVAYNLHTHQQLWSKQLPGRYGQALALSSDVVYAASATFDRAYPSPSDRHFWLTMMDLRSGQAVRQLQSNDSSFRIGQLLADEWRLLVQGADLEDSHGSSIFTLGR